MDDRIKCTEKRPEEEVVSGIYRRSVSVAHIFYRLWGGKSARFSASVVLRITFLIVLPTSLLSTVRAEAEELIIDAGQEYEINTSPLSLDRLVIGDGARLTLAEGLRNLSLSAKQVDIGQGVVMDFRGHNGLAGLDGSPWPDPAPTCKDGQAGRDGKPGSDGGDGADVFMHVGLLSLGSLNLLADGGSGGQGGRGGRGQDGGRIQRCQGPSAGDGGMGGDAGAGGRGGRVEFVFEDISSQDKPLGNIAGRIKLSVKAGEPGLAGAPGQGGDAVKGQYLNVSYGSGKKWLAGGEQGRKGSAGKAGLKGRAGTIQFRETQNASHVLPDMAKAGLKAAATGAASASRSEVELLREQFNLLEQQLLLLKTRLDALESTQ
jgi:hypothetical protein